MRAPWAFPDASCLFHWHRLQRPRTGRSAVTTQRTHQQSDCEKTSRVGRCFNVLRHVNSVRAERLLAELDAENHIKTPGAATSAPTPMNELEALTRVIQYVPPHLWQLFWNHLCQVSTLYKFLSRPHSCRSSRNLSSFGRLVHLCL